MIASGLARCDQDLLSDWDWIRIEPEKWTCRPWGDAGGGFWAVAIEGSNVLWFNDIEEGFNWSQFTVPGVIGEYWCDQDELEHALQQLTQPRATRRGKPQPSGPS